MVFDLASSPIRFKELEELRGQKGLLKISNLAVQSDIEEHDILLFSAVTTTNVTIKEQNIRDLLNLKTHAETYVKYNEETLKNSIRKTRLKN